MTPEEMKNRTKAFSLEIIKLAGELPNTQIVRILVNQLVRAATSVGANYRASCRAKSTADFISKMGTVEEEADESAFWMEILYEAGFVEFERVDSLIKDSEEILAIVVSSIRTTKAKSRR
jgi:four helix bundle protein